MHETIQNDSYLMHTLESAYNKLFLSYIKKLPHKSICAVFNAVFFKKSKQKELFFVVCEQKRLKLLRKLFFIILNSKIPEYKL